ncbi:ATP-binding protein [candidate division WOR-3 bacterium]|nr:ATP-binding protein [candidate division WOR-3 bacterium]
MSNSNGKAPKAYESAQEWLEGKRRVVRLLRRLCGGGRRSRREEGFVPDPEMLEAAVKWHEGQHEARTDQARAAGFELPIDRFAAKHGLDPVEREIVELLLVAATDMTDDDGHGGLSVTALVQLLSRGRERDAQGFLPYFLPGCRLRRVLRGRDLLGSMVLGIGSETVAQLLGIEAGQDDGGAAAGATGSAHEGDIVEFLDGFGAVLAPEAADSLRALWGWVRRGDVIREQWGFGKLAQLGSGGVCLLFHGPSGTGKTLTARGLCRALGREALVVSYPELVSKWVGETQKNTSAAFAEAARTGKVLVFDEADAIFARRTAVSTSTDRHANSEVNTLLMELERFPGIVILTTNHAGILDPALERRIRYKVFFGPPDPEARAAIWRKHLPQEAPLDPDVDLERLGEDFRLTGGQIANAALAAAALAAARLSEDGDAGRITMADFEAAARREAGGYAEEGDGRRFGFQAAAAALDTKVPSPIV